MKKTNIVYLFLTLTFFWFVLGSRSYAANGDPIGFNVQPETPEHQIDLNKTYFYIKTEPNQKQTLTVNVTNNEESDITIKTTSANGITAQNGKISYVSEFKDRDKTLVNSIEEITSIEPEELHLKPRETKPVTITVTPPSDHYKGIKLGTLFFKKEETQDSKKENGAQITSEYRYAIDLVTSETDEPLYGGKSLTLDDAQATLLLKKKVVELKFSNADPKVIQDLNIIAQVTEKGSTKVLKSAKLENGRMAPNSHFTFEVPWGIESFKPGTYTVKTTAKSNTDEWEFEKDFTVTSDQAKKMNKETVTKLTLSPWIYWVFGISICVFFGLTAYLSIRRRRWEKEFYVRRRRFEKEKIKKKKEEKNKSK